MKAVVIPGDIFDYLSSEGASTAGFSAYESVTYRDLLYGALLSSGAECCLTLSAYLGGSEEMYVQMMNEKAAELEMNNTHFTNSIGLHNYNHYSTAEDIAKLLIYALDNEEFREIFTSQSYYTETDYQPYGITLSSTMFSELDSEYFTGGVFLGGKTGYTSEAGNCLASLARVNGKEYILITTGAESSDYMGSLRIADAVNIYETLAKKYINKKAVLPLFYFYSYSRQAVRIRSTHLSTVIINMKFSYFPSGQSCIIERKLHFSGKICIIFIYNCHNCRSGAAYI